MTMDEKADIPSALIHLFNEQGHASRQYGHLARLHGGEGGSRNGAEGPSFYTGVQSHQSPAPDFVTEH
ncbi:MAG: hypothetical protein FRX49_13222 [Trebouxia sp. A1-2]|nr:MAG: hypothetical protein FRX49_13222 [Trebouxia sp. A1-2]